MGIFTKPDGFKKSFIIRRYPHPSNLADLNYEKPFPEDANQFSDGKEAWTLTFFNDSGDDKNKQINIPMDCEVKKITSPITSK